MPSKRTSLSRLDPETREEIREYLHALGDTKRSIWKDVMPFPEAEEDMRGWLHSKLQYEGDPEDEELIDRIGRDGRIRRPVIIDAGADYTVEGRHRLAAALKYGLDVPVIILDG